MAYKYAECEFCANHGHHDFCEDCEEGDGFEPLGRAKKKFPPIPVRVVTTSLGRHPTDMKDANE
jgi:hypothetical protein